MKQRYKGILFVLIIITATIIFIFMNFFGIRFRVSRDLSVINLPDGFVIEVFAEELGKGFVTYPGPNTGPRMMLFKNDILFTSIPSQGRVVALPDENKDYKADKVITFIDKLNRPHGIETYEDWFYIAEENRIIRVKDLDNDLKADLETLEVLIDDIPTGGHFTRTIKIHDDSLYISVGSSCNVCFEEDERRAVITKCDLEGNDCKVFASGLRNAVGFVFHPITNEIYATDNGRDLLGEDLPPDEINIVKEGKHYGWPICFGKNIHDTDFDKNVYIINPCFNKEPSLVDLQAHSAPLGLAFYYGNNFPEEYKGNLFVAYHGSWNRDEPTGYKIVRIKMDSLTVEDFATGWLQGTTVSGRPVDIVIAEDGSMFVSDDNAGKIYRIFYQR